MQNLVTPLVQRRQELVERLAKPIPLLVKLAPDLSDEELDDALQVIQDAHIDGVIATNTTISRPGVKSPLAGETGGLSGAPLRAMSTRMVQQIHRRSGGKLPVIGVGGISCAADAREKLDAGAVLVQVYTGMIYMGPGMVKTILAEL